MYKCSSETAARAMAMADEAFYGVNIHDGKVYVGTIAELKEIDVTDIKDADGHPVEAKS